MADDEIEDDKRYYVSINGAELRHLMRVWARAAQNGGMVKYYGPPMRFGANNEECMQRFKVLCDVLEDKVVDLQARKAAR